MTRKALYIVGAIVVAVLGLLWAKSCADKGGEQPKIPPAVQRDLDSLRVTQPTHDAQQDTLRLRARQDSIARVAAQRRAAQAEQDARAARHRADSMAAVAESAAEWKDAHDERQREAQQWEQTATEKESALQSEIASHNATKLALSGERTRRIHLETVTVPGLTDAIRKLERPCRVAFLPCPSRTVVGILGAGGGYLIGQYVPPRR